VDVADDLLAQRALGDPEQISNRDAREDRRAATQEELARISIEDDEAERLAASQPSWPRRSVMALR
jgi:hypothetical protein